MTIFTKNDKPPRVDTPTVLQMEAVECGPASLAMILEYHGKVVPLEQLRKECGVSRDGSKANNIVRTARAHGLVAKGYQRSTERVLAKDLPSIAFWNYSHFLVVEGSDTRWVYLNDPASGKRKISHQEFEEGYSGISLTFSVGEDFRRGGKRPSAITALLRRLEGSRSAIVYAVIAGLFLLIPGLVVPVFSKVFVDSVLVAHHRDWFPVLVLSMILTAALQAVLTWLQQKYLLRLETKVALTESARYFWHILRLPIDFFNQRYAGDIAQRVQINDKVARLISGRLATTFLNTLMVAFYAAVMVSYHPILAAVTMSVVLLNVFILRVVAKKIELAQARLSNEEGRVVGVSMNGLQIIETLKATGSETDFFSHWAGFQAKAINSQKTVQIIVQSLNIVPTFLQTLSKAAMLGLGALFVIEGDLTLGALVAFQSLAASFTSPVQDLVSLSGEYQQLKGDMARLDDVLRYSPELDAAFESPGAVDISQDAKLHGAVEMKNVTFGYSPLDPPLVQDFSLSIKPGQRVALVGMSGSGKSTLSKLICGLYKPWSGEILFDGIPREQWPRSVLSSSIALVDQDIVLYAASVKDNIGMWNADIPEIEIVRAAKDADIHSEIISRAGGYASPVAEGGKNYSGGQAQRLDIARALAQNPTILVLDEATSALDPVTEQHIDDAIRRRGCTTVVIAHRLSTIRDADEIIVLDRGVVVQRGTHDQLMSDPDGTYARLIATE